jgi:hypothetical protein
MVRRLDDSSVRRARQLAVLDRFLSAWPLVLLMALAACATRLPHADTPPSSGTLSELTVKQLVFAWEEQLRRYIDRQGHGDPAVLSQTRVLHSRDVLRPARITFDALDLESEAPGRDGWDVQGVLIGKQASAGTDWYIFLVGIIRRGGYRPLDIDDIRVVGFSLRGGRASWQISAADPSAVQRYRDSLERAAAIRFPGDTDRFSLEVSGDRMSVTEVRSGVAWSLGLIS